MNKQQKTAFAIYLLFCLNLGYFGQRLIGKSAVLILGTGMFAAGVSLQIRAKKINQQQQINGTLAN